MGNVVPNGINCPAEEVLTDELLAEASGVGGAQVAVTADDNPFANDFEEVMLTWWLLSYVKVRFSANGTYREANPDPFGEPPYFIIPWSFSKDIFFDIAYKPNTGPGGKLPEERITDCELYNEFPIRKFTENEPGPDFRVWEAWTHYFPFHGISGEAPSLEKDFPSYGLLELFCFVEPIVGEAGTNFGLFIISTRNRDYKDVIFEGRTPGTADDTTQIGFKTTTFTFFNKQTTLYLSFWALNTNFDEEGASLFIEDFNIEILESKIWQPA